jgi:hypothetical protein
MTPEEYKKMLDDQYANEQVKYQVGEQASPDIAPPSDMTPYQSSVMQRQQAVAPNMEQAGELSKVAGVTTTSGAASGNPELAAAGLGLQAAGMIQQAKQAQRNAKYTAEVNKVNARQDAINKMAQVGQGLRA